MRPFQIITYSAALMAGVLSVAPLAAAAEGDSEIILDMLQKRGVLSEKDASQVRSELSKEKELPDNLDQAASKLKLSDSITEAKIYGQLRLTYRINEGEAAGLDSGDSGEQNRLRYLFRLGADVKLQDGWSAGFMLETNNSARAALVTLGSNPFFAKSTVTKDSSFIQGVTTTPGKVVTGFDSSGKAITGTAVSSAAIKKGSVVTNYNYGDTVFVGRVFLKYDPTDWLTLSGGKISNPFVSTRMIWDPDLNPEGFAEQFHTTLGGSVSSPMSEAASGNGGKDVKAIVPASVSGPTLDLYANFAQFIYDDVGFENTFNSGSGPFTSTPNLSSRWMLGWQVGAKENFNKSTYIQVSPALYSYTGGGISSAGPYNGDSPLVILDKNANPKLVTFNQTGVNNLLFMELPVTLGFKIGALPATVFGDFAYNFDANTRAAKAGHPNDGGEDLAYQVGLSLGAAKKKGDWEIRGWWQHTEAYSVDQNIVDDEIFDGRTNMEGFYVQLKYQFTNAVSFAVQLCHGDRISDTLGTGGFGVLGTAPGFPLQHMNSAYFDLDVKF